MAGSLRSGMRPGSGGGELLEFFFFFKLDLFNMFQLVRLLCNSPMKRSVSAYCPVSARALGSLGLVVWIPETPSNLRQHAVAFGHGPGSAQSARLLTYLRVIEPKRLQTRVPPDQLRRWHKVQERVNGCSCEVESVDTVFWEHYNLHSLEAKRQRVP